MNVHHTRVPDGAELPVRPRPAGAPWTAASRVRGWESTGEQGLRGVGRSRWALRRSRKTGRGPTVPVGGRQRRGDRPRSAAARLACPVVKADDLSVVRVPGRPAFAADGQILVAVSSPDLDANLYRGTVVRIRAGAWGRDQPSDQPGGQSGDRHSDQPSDHPSGQPSDQPSGQPSDQPTELTLGPRDSEPVTSPDGALVVFLRAAESGPPQLYAMPVDGGEPRRLTDHPLGAGAVVFAPDGRSVAYCAAVPEAGRYGTDRAVGADAEPPRRVTRLSYRLDGEGFVSDKPRQVFVLDVTGRAAPVASPVTSPVASPGGSAVGSVVGSIVRSPLGVGTVRRARPRPTHRRAVGCGPPGVHR